MRCLTNGSVQLLLLAVLAQAGCCGHIIAQRASHGPFANCRACGATAIEADSPDQLNRGVRTAGGTSVLLASGRIDRSSSRATAQRLPLVGGDITIDGCPSCGGRRHRGKCHKPWFLGAPQLPEEKHEGPLPNPTFRPPYPRFFPVPTEDVFAPRSDYDKAVPLWDDRRMAPPTYPQHGDVPDPAHTPNYGIPSGDSDGASSRAR